MSRDGCPRRTSCTESPGDSPHQRRGEDPTWAGTGVPAGPRALSHRATHRTSIGGKTSWAAGEIRFRPAPAGWTLRPVAATGTDLVLGGVPAVLWTPVDAAGPVPLVLLGHPGGLAAMRPRLAGRAEQALTAGFAAVALELPGSGDRPRLPDLEQAREELRAAVGAGRPVTDDVVDRLVLGLVDRAEPEWRTAVDELLDRPDVDGPVGWSGGVLALGVRMALANPRVAAAALFAGSRVPRSTVAEARRLTVPVHVLLQWDDAGNDRQEALDLFDAVGSAEKTLHANLGGHTGVPAFAGEEAHRFLVRHLRQPTS